MRALRLAATPFMRCVPIASTRACSIASNTARASPPDGAMQAVIVARHGERRGIGMAADYGDLVLGRNAGGLRDASDLAGEPGRLTGDHPLDAGSGGDRPGGERHGALEGIEGRLFPLRRSPHSLKATLA